MTTHSNTNLIKEQSVGYTADMPERKKKTAIFHGRLSDTADSLIDTLAAHLGLSRTSVIEQAVRAFARQNGIPVPSERKETEPLTYQDQQPGHGNQVVNDTTD